MSGEHSDIIGCYKVNTANRSAHGPQYSNYVKSWGNTSPYVMVVF
jgi:hypothetical protein